MNKADLVEVLKEEVQMAIYEYEETHNGKVDTSGVVEIQETDNGLKVPLKVKHKDGMPAIANIEITIS